MKHWATIALDCGLLNYVDHDNQNYFIDAHADVYTVRQFVHDLTEELVAENERLRGERDRQYDMNVSLIAENQKLRVECGHTDAALEIFEIMISEEATND